MVFSMCGVRRTLASDRLLGTSWPGKLPGAGEGRLGCEDLKCTGFSWEVLDFVIYRYNMINIFIVGVD